MNLKGRKYSEETASELGIRHPERADGRRLKRRGGARVRHPWIARASRRSTSAPPGPCGRTSLASGATPRWPTTCCRRASCASFAPIILRTAKWARGDIFSGSRPTCCAIIGGARKAHRSKTSPPNCFRRGTTRLHPTRRRCWGRPSKPCGPRERQLLWLAYAEGYSHREIAEITGLASASIRLLLFRARRKIARLLTDDRRVP